MNKFSLAISSWTCSQAGSAITRRNESKNYFTSSYKRRRGVIKNEWSLIAKINPERRALVRKIKKSSQEDHVVTRVSKM